MYFSKCYNGTLRLQFRLTPEGRNNNNNKKGRRRGSLGSSFIQLRTIILKKVRVFYQLFQAQRAPKSKGST